MARPALHPPVSPTTSASMAPPAASAASAAALSASSSARALSTYPFTCRIRSTHTLSRKPPYPQISRVNHSSTTSGVNSHTYDVKLPPPPKSTTTSTSTTTINNNQQQQHRRGMYKTHVGGIGGHYGVGWFARRIRLCLHAVFSILLASYLNKLAGNIAGEKCPPISCQRQSLVPYLNCSSSSTGLVGPR